MEYRLGCSQTGVSMIEMKECCKGISQISGRGTAKSRLENKIHRIFFYDLSSRAEERFNFHLIFFYINFKFY